MSISTEHIRPTVSGALRIIEEELEYGAKQGNSIAYAALQTFSELVEAIRRAPSQDGQR